MGNGDKQSAVMEKDDSDLQDTALAGGRGWKGMGGGSNRCLEMSLEEVMVKADETCARSPFVCSLAATHTQAFRFRKSSLARIFEAGGTTRAAVLGAAGMQKEAAH